MDIKVLIFDKDGTLTDSVYFWKNFCFNVAQDILKKYGFENNRKLSDRLMELVGFRKDGSIIPESIVVSGTSVDIINGWIEILKGEGITADFDDLSLRFERDYRYGKVLPLHDSIKEVFEHYYNRGFKIALATSDNHDSALYCCKEIGIDRYITVIASKDRVTFPKPHPASMELICKTFSVTPQESVMIGDSENDMIFAKKSGAKSIFLNKTSTSKTADYNIKDIKEILDII